MRRVPVPAGHRPPKRGTKGQTLTHEEYAVDGIHMITHDIIRDEELSSEWKLVFDWRVSSLVRAGVERPAAEELARDLHVNLHEAIALKCAGCTDELLVRILV
jgi:hypothetical protein